MEHTTPINLQTGEVTLDGVETVLGPNLSLDEFLWSAISRGAAPLPAGGNWRSYQLPPQGLGGTQFHLQLYFNEGKLARVCFALVGDFGEAWAESTERRRLAAMNQWLADQAGIKAPADLSADQQHEFPWGVLATFYDQRSGGSEVFIKYLGRE